MNQSLSAISQQQEERLAQLLNPTMFIQQLRPKHNLRKLPLFGEKVTPEEINFEYPRPYGLDALGDADSIRLRSLYFMSLGVEYQPIGRVTCIYDNGNKSPNLACRGTRHEYEGRVDFPPNKVVRSVKMSHYAQSKLPAIGFFDEQGDLICGYDPEGFGFDVNVEEQHLEEGESLIGVYGVKDKAKWFTSFGLIAITLPKRTAKMLLTEDSNATF